MPNLPLSKIPRPVLRVFTEVGGSRPVMANPGKRFEATDVIRDESIPRKRLIFAGVAANKCFVLYEQGGLGHLFLVDFFELTSGDEVHPLWRGHCGPAADIRDLRSHIDSGCS